MDYRKCEKLFYDKYSLCKTDNAVIGCAYRLYGYELFADKNGLTRDIDYIKSMVDDTSHVLEDMYHLQNEDGSISFEEMEGVSSKGIVHDTAVFISLMCLASRVYDDLDPIFSRDLIHAAIHAGHYLMVGDFKDDIFSEEEKIAQIWAYCELLKTDEDLRNAYDHSLMAGMPQKMSRQKRYKHRLKALWGKLDLAKEISQYPDTYSLDKESSDRIAALKDIAKNIYDIVVCFYIPLTGILNIIHEIGLMDVVESALTISDFVTETEDEKISKNLVLMPIISFLLIEEELKLQKAETDSQLIKVIEYNILRSNLADGYSDEEIGNLSQKKNNYAVYVDKLV